LSVRFQVLGLDHITVTSPEELEQETIEWYQSCLGLRRVDKPPGTSPSGAWLVAGDQEVHVAIDPHNPHREAHMALAVDDFDGVVEHLRATGCHLEQASTIPGRRRFYTRDPAGNRIEILAFDRPQRASG
jgi:muramoyltetrapeptide carboxypeptidase